MIIKPYLQLLVERNGSDLFFTSDSPVQVKIEGRIAPVGKTVLTPRAVKDAALSLMTERQVEQFQDDLELDFALYEPGIGRFRVNAFHQRGNVAMVLRYIKSDIPSLDDLQLPDSLKELALLKRGMILVVGATGSGKSTTLASMLDYRNAQSSGHILSIEDPIEFVHSNQQSIVNQREVGVDTHSYANALRSALREAPDVILIGETRDRETMESVVELAGSGHLCISTLHANNAHQALDRVLNMFPEEMHRLLLMDFSMNLKAIVSQRLVQSRSGRRVAAIEVLINNAHFAELIRDGRFDEVGEAMAKSTSRGIQTFDDALLNLYKSEVITLEEALRNADSRSNLEARINFGK